MIISERIYKIMKERGLTQQEFSAATGISQSTISDWKRKKTNPASDKIMRICDVLEITPYELLQDTIPKGKKKGQKEYRIISEGTDAYDFFLEYDKLDKTSKDRLLGYLKALCGK